ncbi:glycerophosphodiester phosphodiesterase [Thorsellia kenyensis]|uniref:Glycerophosphodiester phosphodiesterase n=1 Tax=Thorsellia kenyensis TaxID=1549888 RepID=A0ABV6C8F7_9GAMM
MEFNGIHWPFPKVVAHRGAGKHAPENTLAAMELGAKQGHKMVEFDVTLSADDVAFLLHDDSLERTANLKALASETSWHTLSKLDAGLWHSEAFKGEPIPTLGDIAKCTKKLDLAVNIEIKPANGLDEYTGKIIADQVVNLFKDHSLPPLISSFSIDTLIAVKNAQPKLWLGYLMHEWKNDWQTLIEPLRTKEGGIIAIHLNHTLITTERLAEIKALGLFVFVYTVNDLERAKYLLELGIDAICTDETTLIKP